MGDNINSAGNKANSTYFSQNNPNPAARYTLERHLQSFALHKEYQYLCNSWIVEKEEYKRELEVIINTI
jgi:hypothetical protein